MVFPYNLLTLRSDGADHGFLYGLNIELTARKGCVLETVIAEQNQYRSADEDGLRATSIDHLLIVSF
jgi:hypothetical protein